jgi:hypothetical protein
MSSILFAMEVVAFLVVAVWAYRNDRVGAEEGGTGLLAFRSASDAPPARPQRWRKDFRAKGIYARRSDMTNAPQPRWKSRPAPRRW